MTENPRILTAYFSASGQTAKLARTISEAAGGDLFEIAPTVPYTAADLDWRNSRSRSSIEMKDKSSRPPLKETADISRYDVILVGFPIWWYEAPRIIESFLESADFTGKIVVPFATSGGSGLGKTEEILHRSCPAAKFLKGRKMSPTESQAAVSAWLHELGI